MDLQKYYHQVGMLSVRTIIGVKCVFVGSQQFKNYFQSNCGYIHVEEDGVGAAG